jgi:hypothetical protein
MAGDLSSGTNNRGRQATALGEQAGPAALDVPTTDAGVPD